MVRLIALTAAISLAATACVAEDSFIDPMDGSSRPEAGLPEFAADCPLRIDSYAIDRYTLPVSASLANDMGLNIDEDEVMRPDNAIGQVYASAAAFTSYWSNKQVADSVDWRLEIARCSDGSDDVIALYMLGPDDERIAPAVGQLDEAGVYAARRGVTHVPVSAFFDGGAGADIEWAEGRGVSLRATLTDDGDLEGTLAFAIEEDGEAAIVAGVYDAAQVQMAIDPVCISGSPDCFWTGMFDEDGDGDVSYDEIATSSAVSSLLSPDVDLLDGSGLYWPRHDEIKESLSFGFDFHAIAVND
jgi:hypothetical protein